MTPGIAFLLYTSRSGSTYFAAQLDRLRGISCTIESDFIVTLLYLRQRLPQMSPGEIASRLLAEEKFRNWGLSKATLEMVLGESERNVEAITHALLKATFRNEVECYVMKVQGADRYIEDLRHCFDSPRFVHLIRDPRAVYNSQRQRRARASGTRVAAMSADPSHSARRWRDRVRRLRQAGGQDLLEVRYEDMVKEQGELLANVSNFLGVAADCRQEAAHGQPYFARIPASERDVHRNVANGEPLVGRTEAWRHELDEADVHLIQSIAYEEMVRLGYQPIDVSERARSWSTLVSHTGLAKIWAGWQRCRCRLERGRDPGALRYGLWRRCQRMIYERGWGR